MSIDNQLPTIVQAIDRRLRDALAKARSIKQAPNIETALQSTDLEEAATISSTSTAQSDQEDETKTSHTAFETAARNIFYEILSLHSIDQPDFVEVWNLLDLLQICADHKQCDPSLALWLIEELLDSQTINGCRRVFDYLESRRERLITKSFSTNKQMIMLRSCNELLRRLSRAEDAVFCGRVFIFLFQSFPLGDKSSVNLRGEFHVENTTKFDAPPPKLQADEPAADAMEIDGANTKATAVVNGDAEETAAASIKEAAPKSAAAETTKKESKGQELDMDALYTTFWSLQHVFSNPKKVFSKTDFDAFKSGLDVTIKKFKTVPKVLQTQSKARNSDTGGRGLKRKRGGQDDDSSDEDDFASTFNPKYLTSRDLFELEMSDLTFQRHILVQALILIDFLLSLTPKAKKRLADLSAQRAMVYDYTLSDDDAKWANSTRTTIATYLQSLPGGNFHHRMVSTILARDKNWVRWKVESCPQISRPPVATKSYTNSRDGAKRVTATRKLKSIPMGAIDVSFLSDSYDRGDARLEQLKKSKGEVEDVEEAVADDEALQRQKVRLERYMREIENVDLDIEMAPSFARLSNDELARLSVAEKKEFEAKRDEHDHLVSDRSNRTWKVIRLAAEHRMGVIGKIDESKTESMKIVLKDKEAQAAAASAAAAAAAEANHADSAKASATVNGVDEHGDSDGARVEHSSADAAEEEEEEEEGQGYNEDASGSSAPIISYDGASDSRPMGSQGGAAAEDEVLVPATQEDEVEMADAGDAVAASVDSSGGADGEGEVVLPSSVNQNMREDGDAGPTKNAQLP